MPIMTDRVFLLVSVHQGAVLGMPDEMLQIIEGRTPPAIVKWTRFEAWGE